MLQKLFLHPTGASQNQSWDNGTSNHLGLAVPGSILKENNFFYFLLCGSTHTVAKEVLGVFFD